MSPWKFRSLKAWQTVRVDPTAFHNAWKLIKRTAFFFSSPCQVRGGSIGIMWWPILRLLSWYCLFQNRSDPLKILFSRHSLFRADSLTITLMIQSVSCRQFNYCTHETVSLQKTWATYSSQLPEFQESAGTQDSTQNITLSCQTDPWHCPLFSSSWCGKSSLFHFVIVSLIHKLPLVGFTKITQEYTFTPVSQLFLQVLNLSVLLTPSSPKSGFELLAYHEIWLCLWYINIFCRSSQARKSIIT
jgi:hypothetical protein